MDELDVFPVYCIVLVEEDTTLSQITKAIPSSHDHATRNNAGHTVQ